MTKKSDLHWDRIYFPSIQWHSRNRFQVTNVANLWISRRGRQNIIPWGLKLLDFLGVCLTYFPGLKDFSDMQEDDHIDWFFLFVCFLIIVAHNFLGENLLAFLCRLFCVVELYVIALWVSPLFFRFDGNLWWCYISIASHMRSASAIGGSCIGLKCQYRLMYNVWQHPLCMAA